MAHSRSALSEARWPEVAADAPGMVLVPVGSCEQHGPHLPFDTDTRIAVAVANAVARRRDDVLLAPALAYGSSGEHQSFPGTLSIGTEALVQVLVELGRSAFPEGGSPHRALVFVNGHGGNTAGVRAAMIGAINPPSLCPIRPIFFGSISERVRR